MQIQQRSSLRTFPPFAVALCRTLGPGGGLGPGRTTSTATACPYIWTILMLTLRFYPIAVGFPASVAARFRAEKSFGWWEEIPAVAGTNPDEGSGLSGPHHRQAPSRSVAGHCGQRTSPKICGTVSPRSEPVLGGADTSFRQTPPSTLEEP